MFAANYFGTNFFSSTYFGVQEEDLTDVLFAEIHFNGEASTLLAMMRLPTFSSSSSQPIRPSIIFRA